VTPPAEQRNAYKGAPPRGWVRVDLVANDGSSQTLHLLVDTGNPCAVIIGTPNVGLMNLIPGLSLNTNFGPMRGGWLRVVIPDIGFDRQVIGYGSDAVVAAAQASSPDFAGLVGLPLLRMMEYGGDANGFWVRPGVAASPSP
jgi:hypothetical protein